MNGASNGASYWRSTRGNIPDGNLYVVSVTDVCSAIYGERITVQAFRVVLHNLIPGNDGGWNESFLDWLMGTINYSREIVTVQIKCDNVGGKLTRLSDVVVTGQYVFQHL